MYVTSPFGAVESEIAFPIAADDAFRAVNTQEMTFEAGDSLFFDGDDADYIYEVIEGVVRSSKMLMDGRRQVVNFCYPGEMVGVSHDKRYHCDCDAISKVRVRIYPKNAYMEEMAENPEFCARLLKNTAEEVSKMQEHFMMLGRKSAMEKMASFLVAVMEHHRAADRRSLVLDLPMSRSDIADFLGMTIETVSRNLTKLRKSGVINLLNTHQVQICKPDELRHLAENEF